MSVDINWDTLTSGEDGVALAETIRAFIHDRFQHVTLPRFIRSVKVHSFDFGTVCPEIEIKDICDPLPDFYEEEEEEEENDSHPREMLQERRPETSNRQENESKPPDLLDARSTPVRTGLSLTDRLGSPLLLSRNLPGIPGGTANLSYFHLPLGAAISGSQTPFAAFTNSAAFQANGRTDISDSSHANAPGTPESRGTIDPPPRSSRLAKNEQKPEDLQVVLHVRYRGNLKLTLTAEILLDYPMPSFVGIPIQLNITGVSFDGVSVLAYIRKRAHFCFLAPEDANVLVGSGAENKNGHETAAGSFTDTTNVEPGRRRRRPTGKTGMGGLLQEIKVESEIGQKENGKQVLKNVGKVEKFVLEQVRRIFENELVYPSFWTFLV